MAAIEIEGLSIHVLDEGQGPVLFALHGIGGGAASFAPLARHCGSRLRVVAWDAPGYGASSDPPPRYSDEDYGRLAARVLEHLGVERAVVMGHSFGAVCALPLAVQYPHLVAGLILIDAALGDRNLDPAVRDARLQARVDAVTRMSVAEMAERRTPEVLAPTASAYAYEETLRVMRMVRPSGYIAAARAVHDADVVAWARRWAGPTLLVWGASDTVTPLSNADRLREAMPQAELAVLPAAGHMVYLEQEEPFVDVVTGFADRCFKR